MPPLRVVIIGSGPAGLTSLKTLLCQPEFDPICIEASGSVGGTFAQRNYENGSLVSSKQLTAFSDFRFKVEGDHPSMEDYVKYLEDYSDKFNLAGNTGAVWAGSDFEKSSRMRFDTKVISLMKLVGADGIAKHLVVYESTVSGIRNEVLADAVVICSGLHVTPAVPHIEGINHLVPQDSPILSSLVSTPPGETGIVAKEGVRVIHSSQYKRQAEFEGRCVVILGIGETSMDLSHQAITGGAKSVTVCHRGGFLSFPKVLNDFKVFGVKFDGELAIDGLITNLFETTYVHRWVAASHFRWHFSDMIIKKVLLFMTGTEAGCNQWVGGLPPERLGRAYVFLNKSSKALPYINRPYKPSSRFLSKYFGTEYIDPDIARNSKKSIDLALFPTHVDSSGRVHFSNSSGIKRIEERMNNVVVRPDLVVYCTGYRQDFEFLSKDYLRPSAVDTREICDSSDLSVAYIGFVRPGVGAIPPIAEQQAMLWSCLILNKVPVPSDSPHYRLLASKTARIQYGVDHSAYMSTLARDMGAMPSLWTVFKNHGLHVLLCYSFGAAFGSFYRLEGPFKSAEMDHIVKTELWETVTRRGLIGNLFMGLIPMCFYATINLAALLLEVVWILTLRPFYNFYSSLSPSTKFSKRID